MECVNRSLSSFVAAARMLALSGLTLTGVSLTAISAVVMAPLQLSAGSVTDGASGLAVSASIAPDLAAPRMLAPGMQLLDKGDNIALVATEASHADVSFLRDGDDLIVTALLRLNGSEETLEGRVHLTDGQAHQMILNSEDGRTRDAFTFRRLGQRVLVTAHDLNRQHTDLARK